MFLGTRPSPSPTLRTHCHQVSRLKQYEPASGLGNPSRINLLLQWFGLKEANEVGPKEATSTATSPAILVGNLPVIVTTVVIVAPGATTVVTPPIGTMVAVAALAHLTRALVSTIVTESSIVLVSCLRKTSLPTTSSSSLRQPKRRLRR